MKKKVLFLIISGALLILSILSLFMFSSNSGFEKLTLVLLFVVCYALFLISINLLFKGNKTIEFIIVIFYSPIELITMIGVYIKGFFKPIMAAIFLFVFLSAFFILIPGWFQFPVPGELRLFAILTCWSVLLSFVGEKILSLWHFIDNSDDLDKKLASKIFTQDRFKYLIYFAFAVVFIIGFILKYSYKESTWLPLIDTSTASFLTFLALERLIPNFLI